MNAFQQTELIQIAKQFGNEAAAHYVAEENACTATYLDFEHITFTCEESRTIIDDAWSAARLPTLHRPALINLQEFGLTGSPAACCGVPEVGIYANQFAIGVPDIESGKVEARQLLHELAHAIRVVGANDYEHSDAFSRIFITFISYYALGCDSAKIRHNIDWFLGGKHNLLGTISRKTNSLRKDAP